MKNKIQYITWLRQNRSLCYFNVVLLWVAMLISIPALDLNAAPEHTSVQRFLPSNPLPFVSPRILSKTAPEYSEILTILINEPVLEKHEQIFTTIEHSSLEYFRILIHSILYTQTTSSDL
ncbi:MAG: hypothetical protein EHM64_00755 [Ignavibacteriae bacterium]|nr:MAG: hypothetical protein EHM64_00755 [Ignavibacteriota bacterium]